MSDTSRIDRPRGTRWLARLWWWVLVELGVALCALGLAVAAPDPPEPAQWTVVAVAAGVAVTGLMLGLGFMFYGPSVEAISGTQAQDSAWFKLSRERRRALGRAVFRGAPVEPDDAPLAAWWAAQSLRSLLPQASWQTGIGCGFLAMNAVTPPPHWPQLVPGLLFLVLGVIAASLTPRLRRALQAAAVTATSAEPGPTEGPAR